MIGPETTLEITTRVTEPETDTGGTLTCPVTTMMNNARVLVCVHVEKTKVIIISVILLMVTCESPVLELYQYRK